ncbi:MAG: hypothetical protein EBZ49_09680 [Proteobacteria bacterium]|nr:hypothetical protein [Pseudomonadota bacterium]NDC24381.1 hypothetical protein [Pseudomonadota bacterium]
MGLTSEFSGLALKAAIIQGSQNHEGFIRVTPATQAISFFVELFQAFTVCFESFLKRCPR